VYKVNTEQTGRGVYTQSYIWFIKKTTEGAFTVEMASKVRDLRKCASSDKASQ
jgi:hypothetical protein